MLLNFSLIILFVRQIVGFSFDTHFPFIFDNPDNDTNYFGYSVVIYKGQENSSHPWLKVGAPKAKFNRDTTGAVFNCILNQTPCTKMDELYSAAKGNKTLLGSAMDINNNKVVVCGPRHYETVFLNERWDYTPGICFWFDATTNTTFTPYKPLWSSTTKEKRVQTPPGKEKQAYYGMGMAGFSVHLPTNKDDELLVGAPVVYNSIGTPLIVKDNHNDIVPSVYSKTKDVPQAKLFGYAVSSGYYKGRNEPLYYAASTPKGHQYKGQVVFFQFGINFGNIQEKWILGGEQLGEHFGSSMFSGDINGNSYDDIIIGAPFFKKETYNEGRVYIYLGTKDTMTKLVIDGYSINGQFGSALMILDDINGDGYKEVAVGAPYEDDSGVVYIYKGTKTGVEINYCQKIEGKTITYKSPIRGFGISLSKSTDLDNNEAKDFAVGAYLSGHTVLLRNKPVVKIDRIFQVEPHPILKEKNFTVRVCYIITSTAKVTMKIETEVAVDWILERAVVQNNTKQNTTYEFKKNVTNCLDFEVELLKINLTDIENPVPVKTWYKLLNDIQLPDSNTDGFCKSCPVLENSIKTLETNVPFGVNCGSDDLCEADLSIIGIEIWNLKNDTFILGTKENLVIIIEIKNKGENAYFTELELRYPEEVQLIGQSQCVDLAPAIDMKTKKKCPLKDPLTTNTTEKIILEFDLTQLNNPYYNLDYLSISFDVHTSSKMLDDKKVHRTEIIPLKRLANFTINGLADEVFFYDRSAMINFTQEFKVEKVSISSVERAKIMIQVPYMAIISDNERIFIESNDIPTVTLNQQSSNCNIRRPTSKKLKEWNVNGNVRNGTIIFNCSMDEIACAVIECSVGPFIYDYEVGTLKFELVFNVSQFSEFIGPIEKIHIFTRAEVQIKSLKYFILNSDIQEIENIFQYVPTFKLSVQLWILAAATLAGLLVLCIIIFLLYKMGFFKRNKKTELECLMAQITHDQILRERENVAAKEDDSKSFQYITTEELEENNLYNVNINRHENPATGTDGNNIFQLLAADEYQENDIYGANVS